MNQKPEVSLTEGHVSFADGPSPSAKNKKEPFADFAS
jgi:hypothetical protein